MKVVHLTSAHPREDVRIFVKQCRSLAAAGHSVTLIVADGRGDEVRDGVTILDAGRSRGRAMRMMFATSRVLARAMALDADIHHLHDPELLPAGLLLKLQGRLVVFDAHEDLPRQILTKYYLPRCVREPVSSVAAWTERFLCRRVDAVVAATPMIAEKFRRAGIETRDVANFPVLDEFEPSLGGERGGGIICYIGSISRVRGIREMIEALRLCSSKPELHLAGKVEEANLEDEIAHLPDSANIVIHGLLSRTRVANLLARSSAGLVVLHPTPAYLQALPVKMFEYMAAGVPVIASNFPLWRDIVEGVGCGICVDPHNPHEIADAIDQILASPEEARRMGENGYRAVIDRFSWTNEAAKLCNLYEQLA